MLTIVNNHKRLTLIVAGKPCSLAGKVFVNRTMTSARLTGPPFVAVRHPYATAESNTETSRARQTWSFASFSLSSSQTVSLRRQLNHCKSLPIALSFARIAFSSSSSSRPLSLSWSLSSLVERANERTNDEFGVYFCFRLTVNAATITVSYSFSPITSKLSDCCSSFVLNFHLRTRLQLSAIEIVDIRACIESELLFTFDLLNRPSCFVWKVPINQPPSRLQYHPHHQPHQSQQHRNRGHTQFTSDHSSLNETYSNFLFTFSRPFNFVTSHFPSFSSSALSTTVSCIYIFFIQTNAKSTDRSFVRLFLFVRF